MNVYLGTERLVSKLYEEGCTYEEEYNEQFFYHSDHLGSAQLVTDCNGDEYQRIEYTPYGETWVDISKNKGILYLPYKFSAKELDEETGLYYYGARYLDPKASIWISSDPALGEYIPQAPINDEAKKHNQNLPGMGGVFNTVNLNLYHYAANNPVKYIDPDGRSTTLEDFTYQKNMKLNQAVRDNLNFTSSDSMACDKFVTKVLTDAGCLPKNWPDPDWTNVKGYRNFLKNDLSKIASGGWNIVIMISDNPTIELGGEVWETDPTPHIGLMYKNDDGKLTLVHYTDGKVVIQNFKNEEDFINRMPYEVYRYDTAEYKSLED